MIAGDARNVMVFMPPGSAKSTYTSKLFPAWLLAFRERLSVIGVSHTAKLAELNSKAARDTLGEFGPDAGGAGLASTAVSLWQTTAGGQYRAAGAEGAVTGFRADIAVIDDPIKGHEAADSELQRDNLWNWYLAELFTRLKPGSPTALVLTRWHEDDLAGRLLLHTPDDWRVIKLPAVAGEDDALGRAPGEWLWDKDPSFGFGALLRRAKAQLEASGASRVWQALYQQEPRAPEGLLFKVAMIRVLDAAPHIPWEVSPAPNVSPAYASPLPTIGPAIAGVHGGSVGRIVRCWDFAATAAKAGSDPDWTVGVKLARTEAGSFVVLDVVRLRGGPDDVVAAVVNTARQDGVRVTVGLPQDPGSAGKSWAATLVRALVGHHVEVSPETGEKEVRARPAASQVNIGNMAVVKAAWNRPLIEELRDFPTGKHDDQVDALSRAFAMFTTAPAPSRRQQVPIMGR